MKFILTLEKFTKQYQQKIDVKDFKKIKKGSKILYMGGQVEVMDNNGYVLKLKGEDGKTFTVNKNQFDHGGMIKENLGKTLKKAYMAFKKHFNKSVFSSGPSKRLNIVPPTDADYETAEEWVKANGKKGDMIRMIGVDQVLDKIHINYGKLVNDMGTDISIDRPAGNDKSPTAYTDVKESVVNEKRINTKQASDYEKKLIKKVPSVTSARAANHNGEIKLFVNYKRYADRAKLKAAGQDLGLTYIVDGRVTNRPGLDYKRGDKMVGKLSNLRITDNWMTFIKESVNEGIVKDLKKLGDEINYLVDADDDTKKIWKKAGFDTEDDDNVILYSYVSSSWPETKKLLDKKRVKYKELEDPNSAGESYIVFKESLNEKVNEARAKKVTKQMWKRMNDDKRFDALLSVVKDPDDAEAYVDSKWEELPSGFERDMVLFELSSQQDGTKASDGKHKHEDHLEEDIEAMWKKTYGEDFVKHYPAVAKIIRQRKINDRREIARIWQDTYGEDFEKEYPALYQKMK